MPRNRKPAPVRVSVDLAIGASVGGVPIPREAMDKIAGLVAEADGAWRTAAWIEDATAGRLDSRALRVRVHRTPDRLRTRKAGRSNVYRLDDVCACWPDVASAIRAKLADEKT